MRLFFLFLLLPSISCCQDNDLKNHFIVRGEILGKDTGKVAINYNDANNKGVFDTTDIINGKFEFSGTVNIVSDANLWTDIKNINFSDKSVIRFLLEAGNISISCSNNQVPRPQIKGSKTQTEWENWEIEKNKFLISKATYQKKADSIYLLSKTDSSELTNLRKLINQLDSINIITRTFDLNYVNKHRNSFFSGFLLSRYKRQLPLDTVQKYYELLSPDVKKSNVGYTVLDYVYPLSDNISFKKANPLNGAEFNEKLAQIKSIHELSSTDVYGKRIDFKNFKGYYIFLDFWASWCKPCIADIPYLKKIINEFKTDSIKFISISLDTDKKKWEKAIFFNKINWMQVSDLVGFHGLIPTYCKIVLGVPQYVLVDRDGKIINSDAPRPDDPELKMIINNLLKN